MSDWDCTRPISALQAGMLLHVLHKVHGFPDAAHGFARAAQAGRNHIFHKYTGNGIAIISHTLLCRVQGEEIVCAKSDLWLTKNGYSDGSFFFPLLRPAAPCASLPFKIADCIDNAHCFGKNILAGYIASICFNTGF